MTEEELLIAPWTFETEADITSYWRQLSRYQLDYHLDDHPSGVCFPKWLLDGQRTVLGENHDQLWAFAKRENIDPWDLIDW